MLAVGLRARKVDAGPLRELDRLGIPRVGVPHHSAAGIRREDAAELLAAEGRAVGDGHHPRMDRVADADAAAVMHRYPRRSRRRVEEGVEDRPAGDGVAPVAHRLGLAEGGRHRARVEVIAADDDRRPELAATDELVDRFTELGALAVAEPAHARGQTLERHALAREPDPARQRLVLAEELEHEPVGAADVLPITRERDPAEWPAAFAEARTDVLGHEPRVAERLREAGLLRLAPQVVAIVDRDSAGPPERDDRPRVPRDRAARLAYVAVRIARAQRVGVGDAGGDVPVERVVRARLIGHDVDPNAAPDELGEHVGGVRDQTDAARRPALAVPLELEQDIVERDGRSEE